MHRGQVRNSILIHAIDHARAMRNVSRAPDSTWGALLAVQLRICGCHQKRLAAVRLERLSAQHAFHQCCASLAHFFVIDQDAA
jgi:hypothetical protein